MDAVEPGALVRLALSGGLLPDLLSSPLFVVAAGKGAWPMAQAFAALCPGAASGGSAAHPPALLRGVIAGPRGEGTLPSGLQWFAASHPSPNWASEAAGRAALAGAASVRTEGRLLVLLSGGASSLLCVPSRGLSIDDKTATAAALMRSGVAIDGLNCVRKHLSAIKGGRLAAAAGRSLTLAISDVHGPVADDPSVIGSGPTVGDPTTFADARVVVRQAGVAGQIPPRVSAHLERALNEDETETPAPGDPRLADAEYQVIGSRALAMAGAARAARALGYEVEVIAEPTSGEAREAGRAFAEAALRLRSGDRPVCVIGSGETTVRVTGAGLGGRNQEFALAAVPVLAGAGDVALASAGTDGIDGPTDAAGALIDGSSAARAAATGVDPLAALADNASYAAFRALGDLIVWGPTGTNVGDVHVMLIGGAATRQSG